MNKHVRDCVKLCKKEGLMVLDISYRGKHLHIYCREGVIHCPCTPSDHRWQKKMRAYARRLNRN